MPMIRQTIPETMSRISPIAAAPPAAFALPPSDALAAALQLVIGLIINCATTARQMTKPRKPYLRSRRPFLRYRHENTGNNDYRRNENDYRANSYRNSLLSALFIFTEAALINAPTPPIAANSPQSGIPALYTSVKLFIMCKARFSARLTQLSEWFLFQQQNFVFVIGLV